MLPGILHPCFQFGRGNKRLWSFREVNESEENLDQRLPSPKVQVPVSLPTFVTDPESDKWPIPQIMRLLRFYAAHRCLWDLQCEDNRNRRMRHAALIDIAAAMGGGVTKDQVVQKINVIRATYRYEKKRIKQRMRRGEGAKTKLKWFALADAFLRRVPKKGCSKEDPPNSDTDLEDAVIFTINPETLIPLEPEIITNEPQLTTFNSEALLMPKTEADTDESQHSWNISRADTCQLDDDQTVGCAKKPKLEALESQLLEQLKCYKQAAINTESQRNKENYENIAEYKKTVKQEGVESDEAILVVGAPKSITPSSWSLESSLQFIHLLKEHPELFNSPEDSREMGTTIFALESIANVMQKPLKSIEKRWNVLKNVYEEEKQKMLLNPKYKPPYKWWSEAQKVMESQAYVKIESVYLEEKTNSQYSSDTDAAYEQCFQNPIPSVAPLSNMNEAMASLFHEDFSSSSNTHSSNQMATEPCPQSVKIVWNGLEDDLLEGKWSLKHSVKFLRLYGAHSCLWDLNDPNYRSRSLRNAAIEDISAAMGHGLTPSYVAKKIKIFRITYMQQRKRMVSTVERGEKPEILLKWFPLADSFLRPHIGLRSIKPDAKEIPQFDLHYVYANLNVIDPDLLTDFRGKGTQNAIAIGNGDEISPNSSEAEQS